MSLASTLRTVTGRTALAGLALVATACSEYEFAEQDLSVQHLAETDQVILEIDTRGLFATKLKWGESPKFILERARDRVRRMATGERYLHLLTFPLIFDLDADVSESAPEEEPWIAPEALVEFRNIFLKNVHVDASSAYLDAEGEVAVTQSVRLEEATACIAAINALITSGVRDALKQSDLAPKDDVLQLFESKRSRDNLRAFMDAGGDWLTLSEEQLAIRIPMTPADVAILIKGLAGDEDGNAKALGTALLGGLDELVLDNGVALFRFPVEKDGAIHWRYRGERNPAAKKLAAAFNDAELKPQ
ncbi:MAG: hypothetical protein ACJA0P_003551 [Planctomycetota bacterium]|jgi:hypothetical protein